MSEAKEIRQCDADEIRGLFNDLFNLSNDVREKARALRLPEGAKPEAETTANFPDFKTEINQGLRNTIATLRKAQDSLIRFIG